MFSFKLFSEYHPTVWFNAWKYQSSEQIWAGIGHAIITQLVAKLDSNEQEKFWYWLKAGQINQPSLQRRILRYLYQNLPVTVLSGFLVLILFTGAWYLFDEGKDLISLVTLLLGGGSGFWTFKNVENIRDKLKSTVSGDFAEAVRTPDYKEKLGLYHQLTEDLQRVFEALIDPMKPAIVFIDDLDRCSPKVVADVMEAINLIMTNPMVGERCYFIFGMDAQVVAATLDEKYKNLKGRLPGREHTYGSVGWYFLDKFIQLPFIIPIMQNDEKKKFLNDFFVTPKEEKETGEENSMEEMKQYMGEAMDNQEEEKISQKFKEIKNTKMRRDYEKAFIAERIKRYKDDSEEIIEQLAYLSDYLSSSPREIKRYVNLLILHNVHQNLRFHQSQEVPENKEIARWLLISLKWPQLVRWIQWENEQDLVTINTPEIKAKKIDELVQNFIKNNKSKDFNSPEILENWHEYLQHEKADRLKWLKDKQLFQVLVAGNGNVGGLEKAIECRVW